jgi:glycosyltransferase involved in cell wall biosynthesis
MTRARSDGVVAPEPADASSAPLSEARKLARAGDLSTARASYKALLEGDAKTLRASVFSDLGVLSSVEGDFTEARRLFESAIEADGDCLEARLNLAFLNAEPPPVFELDQKRKDRRKRIAVLSFLFNWPSTGGRIHHTVELTHRLCGTGFKVQHFYAVFDPWGLGRVTDPLPFESKPIEFTADEWNAESIRRRYREAVDAFKPSAVLILDAWNFKPHLAEAVKGIPYAMVLQSLECLCPLNNVRMLPGTGGGIKQCKKHQLATADECNACVNRLGQSSGGLHLRERQLSGFGTPECERLLRRSFGKADAVLVMNPHIEALVAPFAKQTLVAPAAIEPDRYPWPWPEPTDVRPGKLRVFFAGLPEEPIKGFDVLRRACEALWRERDDFVLTVTGNEPSNADSRIEWIGWQEPAQLPKRYHEADVCVVPSLCQESFGRVAAEAMGAGKPVVASRIGGLPYTVLDNVTGLLAEPGNPDDFAAKVRLLLDDAELRVRLGKAGRERFEREFIWPVVIDRTIRPLLEDMTASVSQ